jgi:exodeoxyribonuclease-3
VALRTLYTWNVNGARSVYRKGFVDWLERTAPDLLFLQEVRAEHGQVPGPMAHPPGYTVWWNPSRVRRGYSGTALYARERPLAVEFGTGTKKYDGEGRTILAEFGSFHVAGCYFPNGGNEHRRVPFKLGFYNAFLRRCEALRRDKPVLFCGDVNTAHREIDLARPAANRNTTGFLPEERMHLDKWERRGWVDAFRHFHPGEAGHYTWWSMRQRSRERNVGWRLDYFWVAQELMGRVRRCFHAPEVQGSDHCPVGLELEV